MTIDLKFTDTEVSGDSSVLGRLMAVLEEPDPDFAIVTPHVDRRSVREETSIDTRS